MYKRSTVLFSGLDATLTKTGRFADGGDLSIFSKRATSRHRDDEGPRSTILRDKSYQNFGHRSERSRGWRYVPPSPR